MNHNYFSQKSENGVSKWVQINVPKKVIGITRRKKVQNPKNSKFA
jgi:hypothetical protein